jgi:hypothetical protein
VDDDPAQSVPGRDFLDQVPEKVAARMVAVLEAVAAAPPPPAYSGGGDWEGMHDEGGFFVAGAQRAPQSELGPELRRDSADGRQLGVHALGGERLSHRLGGHPGSPRQLGSGEVGWFAGLIEFPHGRIDGRDLALRLGVRLRELACS